MLTTILGNNFFVMVVLVFIAVMLALEAAYIVWQSHRGPQARKLRSRLEAIAGEREHLGQARLLRQRALSDLPALERRLQGLPRMLGLERLLLQSGLEWTVSKLLLTSIVAAAAVFMLLYGVARQPIATCLMLGALAGALPILYVRFRRGKRMRKIEVQLPDALDLIGRALRAGHAFPSALKMAGDELPDPLAGELRIVHDEVNYGVSLPDALSHLSERVPITDLRYFVVAVLIQRESGGNLTEILGNLSKLIRDRLKLLARVRVLSSEGRMSAWILGLMPFFLAGVMNVVNPKFMSPLWTDPIGVAIVQYMLGLMLIGVFIMRHIIRIRV